MNFAFGFGDEPQTVEVALDLGAFDTYHYQIPPPLISRAKIGMRVLVPVGTRRKITGYIIGHSPPPPDIKLKDIIDLLDDTPLFDEKMLRLFRFLAIYLFYPLGEVIKGALPAGINVESRQQICLTPTGLMARDTSQIRGPKAKLLQALNHGEMIASQKLLQEVKEGKYYHIRELVNEGFLSEKADIRKARIKPKVTRFVRVLEGVSVARRASLLRRSVKQLELYRFLEANGETAKPELNKRFGGVDGAIKGLLQKGLIDVEEREGSYDPFFAPLPESEKAPPISFTSDQQEVLDQVIPGLDARKFQPFLLHGVTGSGKTEVYLHMIQRVLANGRQAIVLVPEIALTPQLVGVFRRRLGDGLAVLHSGLSERERYEHWWRIRKGEVPLVIGARSAIFAPFEDVGIIIVDEEHETSYKQDGRFPYHAKNLALVRGKEENATVILGSATPSFESFSNARLGKIGYLSLPQRVNKRPMPPIEVIDMKKAGARMGGMLSPQLKMYIDDTLAAGEQVILFLNRRGYHNSLVCSGCGYSFKCRHCSVTLTYHRKESMILCHYCGYHEPIPKVCPQCKCRDIEYIGQGTERIHEWLGEIFPQARIERMDRDTIGGKKGQLEGLVERFSQGKSNLLIGTQMVAKGHDFHGVTLVGVLLADMGMNLPDFRSAERTFQLLMQVAGRAGRGNKPGRVVIQTFNPEHPSIRYAQEHNYQGFYGQEIEVRHQFGYPPYSWLIALKIEGVDLNKVQRISHKLGEKAGQLRQEENFGNVVFLGPSPAPMERIKNRFRWQILFKCTNRKILHSMLWRLVKEEIPSYSREGVKIFIDPDPIHML